MSRTGTYWSDHNGRLNCAHGVILHGTNCINCERGYLPGDPLPGQRSFVADAVRAAMAGKFHDGGFVPKSMRATGFDTASGEDHVSYVKARVGGDGSFTVEEVLNGAEARAAINGDEAKLEAMQARMSAASQRVRDDLLRAAMRGEGWGGPFTTDPPYHFNCRSGAWKHSPGSPHRQQIEVITDPNDTRGVKARRVGPRA